MPLHLCGLHPVFDRLRFEKEIQRLACRLSLGLEFRHGHIEDRRLGGNGDDIDHVTVALPLINAACRHKLVRKKAKRYAAEIGRPPVRTPDRFLRGRSLNAYRQLIVTAMPVGTP